MSRASRRPLLVWLALVALLALTFLLAHLPMGPFNTTAAIAVALAQTALIGLFHMQLHTGNPVLRLAAVTGFLFLLILFGLTLADVATRAAPAVPW